MKLTVGLGYIPDVQFAQFYLADQAGYYRDAGLDETGEHQAVPPAPPTPPAVVRFVRPGFCHCGTALSAVEVLFAGISSVAIFIILDLEYPRGGLIRIDSADVLLRDLRAMIS